MKSFPFLKKLPQLSFIVLTDINQKKILTFLFLDFWPPSPPATHPQTPQDLSVASGRFLQISTAVEKPPPACIH